MKTADLLSEIRALRVFAAGNASATTIRNSPQVADGLSVAEFCPEFVPAIAAGVTEERSAALEQALVSKLESRFGASDVILLYDQAREETASSFTPVVRASLNNLVGRFRGKTVWVRTPRPELFQDVVHEVSPRAVEVASMRLPGRPDLRQLYVLSASRLVIVSGGPQELLVIQGNREDRVPLRAPWSENARVAFTLAAACALNVSGSPLIAARFGAVAASVAAESPSGAVSAGAISAAPSRPRS